jgi:hypothetical protein
MPRAGTRPTTPRSSRRWEVPICVGRVPARGVGSVPQSDRLRKCANHPAVEHSSYLSHQSYFHVHIEKQNHTLRMHLLASPVFSSSPARHSLGDGGSSNCFALVRRVNCLVARKLQISNDKITNVLSRSTVHFPNGEKAFSPAVDAPRRCSRIYPGDRSWSISLPLLQPLEERAGVRRSQATAPDHFTHR